MNLTALQHSAFLQSLGWAIANSLWQAAILWIVYYIVSASHKNATSKFKNLLSTAMLFSVFAWFIQTFLHKYFLLHDQINSKAIAAENNFANAVVLNPGWKILLNKALNELPYLSIAYLLLLVIFSARLINSYRNINFIKHNGLQKPPVEWRLFTDKVALHIGINKKIKLWFSEHIDVPATLGFLKPVILIPLATVNQLTPDQLEAIILHELSHIQRNDYFINLFISIIETILFFNPFVVLLSKIIKRERENCCDDFVIQYKYDPHSYASALLSLEQSRIMNLRLALTATSGKKQLLVRIKRIMESKSSNTNFNYGQKLLSLILVTGIITSIAWLSPQKKESVVEKTKTAKPVLLNRSRYLKTKEISLNNFQPAKLTIAKTKKNQQQTKIPSILYQQNKVIVTDAEQKKSLFAFDKRDNEEKQNDDDNGSTFAGANQIPATVFTPAAPFSSNSSPSLYFQNSDLLKELSKEIDLKKIRADFEKANFSFSFDWNKWRDDFTSKLEKIQLQDAMVQGHKKFSGEEIEKMVQAEMKNLKARTHLRTVPVSIARPNFNNSNLNKKLFVLIDSIASLSASVLDKSDQACFKKVPEQVIKKLKNATKIYKENARFYSYQNPMSENQIAEKTASTRILPNKFYSYNYELSNGTIILNGKRISNNGEVHTDKINPAILKSRAITVNAEGNKIIEIRIEN